MLLKAPPVLAAVAALAAVTPASAQAPAGTHLAGALGLVSLKVRPADRNSTVPYQGFTYLGCADKDNRRVTPCTIQATAKLVVDAKTKKKWKLSSTTLTTGAATKCAGRDCITLKAFSAATRKKLKKAKSVKTTFVVTVRSPETKTYNQKITLTKQDTELKFGAS